MHLDRRSFLRAAAGTAIGGFVPFGTTATALAQTPGRSGTAALTMASFTPYVNSGFRFTVGRSSVATVLSRVIDERRRGTNGECFSLMFGGPKPAFAQGTYPVDHAALGRFSLFVVPVGRRTDGQDYQAVFNRVTG
jgi:hypothetical protein